MLEHYESQDWDDRGSVFVRTKEREDELTESMRPKPPRPVNSTPHVRCKIPRARLECSAKAPLFTGFALEDRAKATDETVNDIVDSSDRTERSPPAASDR